MHVVTVSANKGGSGRTTAVMALAAGWLALGRKVVVVDVGDEAELTLTEATPPSTLRRWRDRMYDSGVAKDRLTLWGCNTARSVRDAVAIAGSGGHDLVVFDAAARPGPIQLQALAVADLVLVPFTGGTEAQLVSNGILDYFDEPEHVVGLATGLRQGPAARAAQKAKFHAGDLLRAELPLCDLLGAQSTHGWIARHVAELQAGMADPDIAKKDKPRASELADAIVAWNAVLALAHEVGWALDGLRLVGPAPATAADAAIPDDDVPPRVAAAGGRPAH